MTAKVIQFPIRRSMSSVFDRDYTEQSLRGVVRELYVNEIAVNVGAACDAAVDAFRMGATFMQSIDAASNAMKLMKMYEIPNGGSK